MKRPFVLVAAATAAALMIPLAQTAPIASAAATANVGCSLPYVMENNLNLIAVGTVPVRGKASGTADEICVKGAVNSGWYLLYLRNTNECLNYDQSADYVRFLTCTGVVSDQWTTPSRNWPPNGNQLLNAYNGNCAEVSSAGAAMTTRACVFNSADRWTFG